MSIASATLELWMLEVFRCAHTWYIDNWCHFRLMNFAEIKAPQIKYYGNDERNCLGCIDVSIPYENADTLLVWWCYCSWDCHLFIDEFIARATICFWLSAKYRNRTHTIQRKKKKKRRRNQPISIDFIYNLFVWAKYHSNGKRCSLIESLYEFYM